MTKLVKRPAGLAGFFAGVIITIAAGFAIQTVFVGAGLSDNPRQQTEVIYPNW
ncbi:MAG: hypothetical protein AAGF71_14520 [Pseudomonadota bacterium]